MIAAFFRFLKKLFIFAVTSTVMSVLIMLLMKHYYPQLPSPTKLLEMGDVLNRFKMMKKAGESSPDDEENLANLLRDKEELRKAFEGEPPNQGTDGEKSKNQDRKPGSTPQEDELAKVRAYNEEYNKRYRAVYGDKYQKLRVPPDENQDSVVK